jgi:hypothetical protein
MSFIGTGKIKIATYASGASFAAREFVDVGNASVFEFSFSEERKELKDYQDPAGGTAATVVKIDKVEGKMDLRNFRAANLALALWGTTAALGATAITGEAHVVNASAFVPTDRIINTAVAVVVKKGATTFNTADYTVSAGGITFAATLVTAGVVDGDSITIDYTPKAGADVQSLISAAPEVSIFFEGVNAVTGKTTTTRIFNAKLGVASNVGQIGDDFGTLSMTFTVNKDTTVVGAGLSQFIKMEAES